MIDPPCSFCPAPSIVWLEGPGGRFYCCPEHATEAVIACRVVDATHRVAMRAYVTEGRDG